METNLPTPMTARVYVNLPEGNPLLEDLIHYHPMKMENPSILKWTKHLLYIKMDNFPFSMEV